jgi:hypothetical protein
MGTRRPGYRRCGFPDRGGGQLKALFATYALIIVLGLAYFVAIGVANP